MMICVAQSSSCNQGCLPHKITFLLNWSVLIFWNNKSKCHGTLKRDRAGEEGEGEKNERERVREREIKREYLKKRERERVT
jgi:hypothetical protein